MKLQQFSGGLNTKDAPHLLKINQGVQYENIDNESGELKPCKALLAASQSYVENDKFIEHLDTVTTLAKTSLDFIEYQDRIYYSVLDDFIQMKDVLGSPTTEGDLGLDPPLITNLSLIATAISKPLLSEITISETGVTFTDTRYLFKKDTLYRFAFIKVDVNGNQSNPFYLDYTPSITVGLFITLPYDHLIHLKVGGVWRRLISTFLWDSPFWTRPPEPFLANNTYEIILTDFTVTATFFIVTSEEVDLDTLDASLAAAGTYVYLATTGIFNLGWESEPSNFITAIITDSQLPQLTITQAVDAAGVSIIDSRVDRLYLYRLGNTITDFTLVKTIENPNSLFPITITDRDPDGSISGNKILNSEDHDKPLSGLKNLNIINGQLISLLGTKLYFSPIGKLFALPPTNFRDFRNNLISTFNIDAGLLVCSLSKTWLVNTSNMATGKILQLSEEFGCTDQKTMTGYKTGAIWASEAGLATSFGGKVELVAKAFLGYGDLNITHAKLFNETYFGFTTQGTVIAFDMRYGIAIKKFNFLALIDTDINTIIRQIYIQNQEIKVLFGDITAIDSYTIFGATIDETFIWKSPDFIEGSYTDLKTYKDIYVHATKDINFKTFIDDILVDETDFIITDNHHIKVEQESHQGYKISFEATGKGIINEIEYKAMGSQDGR